MAIETNNPTEDFEAFVQERVESGRYQSRNEVLAVAKAAVLQYEADNDLDIDYLRQAIAEGEASGIYEGDVFADLRKKFGWPERT
jgi:putative addiction module CopG family antidote